MNFMARPKVTFRDAGKIRTDLQQIVSLLELKVPSPIDPKCAYMLRLLKIAGLNISDNGTWERAEELNDILVLERVARNIPITPGNHVLNTLRALFLLGGDELRKAIIAADVYTRVSLDTAALKFHRARAGLDRVLPDSWHDISATKCLFDTINSDHFQASDDELHVLVKSAIKLHPKNAGRRQIKEKDIHFVGKLAQWWLEATNQKPTSWINSYSDAPSKFVEFSQYAIQLIDDRQLKQDTALKFSSAAIKSLKSK
jgi:hypothetical protein